MTVETAYDRNRHPDEHVLQLYVLEADEVRPLRARIKKHLKTCAGCASLHEEMVGYYRLVSDAQEAGPQPATGALTLRTVVRRIARDVPVPSRPISIPVRGLIFLVRRPVASSIGVLGILAALLLLVQGRGGTQDINPAFARPHNEFLVALNAQGDELWRWHVGYQYEEHMSGPPGPHPDRSISVVDVDGDGRREVIAVFGSLWSPHAPKEKLRSVYCFAADGSVRWTYELSRTISVGGKPFSDDYRFYLSMAGDFDHDGSTEVMAVATHMPWYPNVLVKLRAEDGAFAGEYWHNGMLNYAARKDLDYDGVEEILLAGQNNRLMNACLVVLDPRVIRGQGPAPAGVHVDGVDVGAEEYYLLLPDALPRHLRTDITNEAIGLVLMGDGSIEVSVTETIASSVHYYFDNTLRCLRVEGSDGYTTAYRRLLAQGKVSAPADSRYYDRLRQAVRYWDGGRFVHEPVRSSGTQPLP